MNYLNVRRGHVMQSWFFSLVKWLPLIKAADMVPGKVHVRVINGRQVAASRVNEHIYVFDGRCPHAGQSLDGGEVTRNGILECPRHSLRLSLNASPCAANSRPVTHVPFRVRDGMVEVNRELLARTLYR
jgi:nitrite reductase/ring-hydroxylating ferredoxin subunit